MIIFDGLKLIGLAAAVVILIACGIVIIEGSIKRK